MSLKNLFFPKSTIGQKIIFLLSLLFFSICMIFTETTPIMYSLMIIGVFIYTIYQRIMYSKKEKEEYKKREWEDHIMNKDHWR